MRRAVWFLGAFAIGFGTTVVACANTTDAGAPGDTGTSTSGTAPANGGNAGDRCTLCVTDDDCNGGVCAQFGGDSYCAKACPNGNECGASESCTAESTVTGDQTSVCVPNDQACGMNVGPGAGSSGGGGGTGGGGGGGCTQSAPADTCGSLNGPSVPSSCKCSSGHTCAANNCYGGWYCNTDTNKCQAPPSPSSCPAPASGGCDAAGGGGGGGIQIDAGGPVSGTVGANGGTVSRLLFGVVGDTRPPVIDDTKGYPTSVITKIWQDIEGMAARPPFVVSTGDYMFASANGTQADPQIAMYLQARSNYTGIAFPAMGNHECTGAVTSNCGAGTTDGMTHNYQTFLTQMLAPLGKTSPNYSVNIDAQDSSWTAKFVFVAGNAWTASDETWLSGVLAQKTTYTFIIRHEPKAAASPGTTASEQIMANYPYTLAIVGHTHTYGKTGPKQVTIGNGGAPLTGGANYGFGLIQQRSDGAIQVDMIDSSTGQADSSFRFALKPDGTPAP